MGEQLTIEIEQSLKKALLRYCKASYENLNAIVGRALQEFIAKAPDEGADLWFGLSAKDYLALSEGKRDVLWNRAYERELERRQLRVTTLSAWG